MGNVCCQEQNRQSFKCHLIDNILYRPGPPESRPWILIIDDYPVDYPIPLTIQLTPEHPSTIVSNSPDNAPDTPWHSQTSHNTPTTLLIRHPEGGGKILPAFRKCRRSYAHDVTKVMFFTSPTCMSFLINYVSCVHHRRHCKVSAHPIYRSAFNVKYIKQIVCLLCCGQMEYNYLSVSKPLL